MTIIMNGGNMILQVQQTAMVVLVACVLMARLLGDNAGEKTEVILAWGIIISAPTLFITTLMRIWA